MSKTALKVHTFWKVDLGLCRHVVNVYRSSVDHGATTRISAADRCLFTACPNNWSIMGDTTKKVTIDAVDDSILCATNTSGVLGNCIEHRLNICRRAGDDAKNFARRCLLLQRLLEFLEQSHVFDGDHRLVSEGL